MKTTPRTAKDTPKRSYGQEEPEVRPGTIYMSVPPRIFVPAAPPPLPPKVPHKEKA